MVSPIRVTGKLLFKKFTRHRMRGCLEGELFDLLPPGFFKDPVSSVRGMGARVLKASRLRWAAFITLSDGRRIFIKRDRTEGWLPSLKYTFFPSKGRKEFLIASQLRRAPLLRPEPLGWMEKILGGLVKESYYLSMAIESGPWPKERLLVEELAKAVRVIHDSGLFHKDFHAGNFLWDGKSFFITDLHRAAVVRSLSPGQKLWNLAHLFHSLRSVWGEEDQILFLEAYLGKSPCFLPKGEELLRRIHLRMDRLQKRQWRSRTKRCLKESAQFSIKKEKGIRYYLREDFGLDRTRRLIEKHLALVREGSTSLAKHSPRVVVSILNEGSNKVCVKQFCYPNFFDRFRENFRRSKGHKAWIAGNGLRARGVPSLRSLAFVEKRDGWGLKESFFLMEAFDPGQEMDRYLSQGFKDSEEKKLFIRTFARWLAYLHRMDLYHQDMKTCNILVSELGRNRDFRLIDLEDVRLDRKVKERDLLRNLVQLNSSIPRGITRTDRLRFFKEYLGLNPIVRDRKHFIRKVVKQSQRRGLLYVSPQGVVEEKF